MVLSFLLAACGGGGDSSSPPDSNNNPPSSGGESGGNGGGAGGDSSGGGDNDGDGDNTGGSDTPSPQPDPTPVNPQPPSSDGDTGSGGSDSGDNGSSSPAPGPLTDIRFDNPRDIEADTNGNLYVVDGPLETARIRQIAPDGSVSTLLDEGSQISNLAVTPAGDIYYSTVGGSQDDSSARTDTIWRLSKGTPTELAHSGVGTVQVQGYWFSQPLPAEDFATLCQQHQHSQQSRTRSLH